LHKEFTVANKEKSKTNEQAAPESTAATATAATPAAEPVKVVDTDITGAKPFRSRKNRQTSTQIESYKPVAPGTTWVNNCLDHKTVVHFPSRKALKAAVYIPASWCAGCAKVITDRKVAADNARKEAEAKASTATPAA
jgi:hypothetical protein